MGLSTFSELTAALKFRHGNNDEFDAYYGGWVNRGYRQLVTMDRQWGIKRSLFFPELMTSADASTVAGTATVAKPTDCYYITEVYDATNNQHLKWMSWNSYVAMTDRYTATGKPTKWHRVGASVYLYPTPDAVTTIRMYYRKIPAVLAGSAVTAIGVEWDDIILDLADFNSRMWAGEYDKAKIMKESATARISEMMTAYDDEAKSKDERLSPDIAMVWDTY
jgi:hypothetical protein